MRKRQKNKRIIKKKRKMTMHFFAQIPASKKNWIFEMFFLSLPRMEKKLTINQEKFAQKYAECGVGAEAYRYAYPGSKKWLDSAVWCNASKLLSVAKVAQRVKQLQIRLEKKSTLTKEAKLSLLEEMLGVQAQDYFDDNGEFKGFSNLTEAQNKALKNFKKNFAKDGTPVFSLELYSKMDILAMHSKMLGHDAPTQIALEVRQPKTMTPEEIENEINKLNNE